MNNIIAWLIGFAFVAGAVFGAVRRLWVLTGIYALTAIGTFVFLTLGGEMGVLLNALTLVCMMLYGAALLWTDRGENSRYDSNLAFSGGRAVGAILIVCATIGSAGLVISALQSNHAM